MPLLASPLAVSYVAKSHVLPCKRPCFAMRNTAFCNALGTRMLRHTLPATANNGASHIGNGRLAAAQPPPRPLSTHANFVTEKHHKEEHKKRQNVKY